MFLGIGKVCARKSLILLMVLFAVPLCVTAQDREVPEGYIYEWLTNIDEAIVEAQVVESDAEGEDAEEGAEEAKPKHIFVYFAGSDWCPYCMRFEKEVINSPTFRRYLEKNFVPVLIDQPRYYDLTEEQQTYNSEMLTKYQIRGFPTVVLLTPDGDAITPLGYNREGANGFIRTIKRAL